MASLGGRKLTQLRVVDLRAELDKRGLDKSGLKGVLVERLEKSLLDDSSELNESAELDSTADNDAPFIHDEDVETPNGEETKPSTECGAIPYDFSDFIVLDSGDDSDHDEDSIKQKDDDDHGTVNDEMDVAEEKENEEVKDETNIEQIDLSVDDQEIEEEEGSLEFEYQASETLEETVEDDKEEDEAAADEEEMKTEETKKEETKKEETKKEETKKEETKKEETKKEETKKEETKKEETVAPAASLPKPNENQLSLSLCVNTDDVQDDLDEDLKEIEKTKTGAQEEEEENADEVSPEMETEENTVEEDPAKIESKTEMAVDDAKVTEGDEPKGEEGGENDVVEDKDTGVEGEEVKKVAVKTEIKEKESEEGEKDVVKEEDNKKDAKENAPKKEEAAKKVMKKEEKKPDKKVEVKEEKKTGVEAKKKEAGKSLWVSNLSSMTRAADLKTRFTQYGKVVGAKIVTNSKAPGAQCFGLVTMSTSEEAAKCIQHLHRTEMHGRNITVDRAKGDRIPTAPPSAKKAAEKKDVKSAPAKAKDDKAKEKEKATEKKPSDKEKVDKPQDKPQDKTAESKTPSKTIAKTGKESDAKGEKGKPDSASKASNRSANGDKKDSKDPKKSTSSSHRSSPKGGDDAKPAKNLKSLDDVRRERRERQIRERRERERRDRVRRERERIAREKAMERERERLRQRERERRRLLVLREREERERQERLRLERERQRQRELERQRERERQERERERLLQERRQREDRERLERERERLERERLQRLERERLERQRIDDRRGVKRPGDAYVRERSPTRGPGYWQDTKRPAPERAADSRDFFGGLSGRERAPREVMETRPGMPARERRSEPRASHSAPKRDDAPRDDHRRVDREHGNVSRSGREPPRERDSRDRRASWETSAAMPSASDPQKGLSLLLQRAGVSGILGDFSGRSGGASLAKPLAPSAVGSSLNRGRPAGSWNGRASAHSRPIVSSQSLTQTAPANPTARVGRPPVMSDSGRNWPTSADKDRERVRERDRGVATRDMSRSSWSASANPASLMASHAVGHDRARQVVAAGRTAVPPRMMGQHSAGQPMGVPASSLMDSRRAVAMSGRSDAFRSGVAGLPRSTAMRRY